MSQQKPWKARATHRAVDNSLRQDACFSVGDESDGDEHEKRAEDGDPHHAARKELEENEVSALEVATLLASSQRPLRPMHNTKSKASVPEAEEEGKHAPANQDHG